MAVTNYLYQYADGSTGNSPFQRDAQGSIVFNQDGSVIDGKFLGRSMPDGSVNQSPIGNVTANGMVNTYDGYQVPADAYYANGANGARPPDGYGYDGSGAVSSGGGGGSTYSGASGGLGLGGRFSAAMSGQNPYIGQLGQTMVDQMTTNFNRNVMPAIGSKTMATGGYGGSRQGVVESNAMNDLNNSIGSALANLYNSGYGSSLNYNLGMGNLGLGYANLDRNINNDNWANQLQGMNVGLNIWDRLQGNNQAAIGAGNTIQKTPMDYWNQFSQGANSIGQGYGTQTQSGPGGNVALGALGGARLGSQLANWWGGGSSPNAAGGSNSEGWGTGAGFGNQDYGAFF